MEVQTSNEIIKHFKLECKICMRTNRFKIEGSSFGNLDETFMMKKKNIGLAFCFLSV